MAKGYVKDRSSEELQNKALEALEVAIDTGKSRRDPTRQQKPFERVLPALGRYRCGMSNPKRS